MAEKKTNPDDHRIITYPGFIICKYIAAEAYSQGDSKARIAEDIIKSHFDKMDELRKDKLLRTYEKMTPEERRYPKKIRRE